MNLEHAAFWLVAAIIAVHAVVVLASVGACLVYSREIVEGKFTCDPHNRLASLLAEALAAALAFSVGRRS